MFFLEKSPTFCSTRNSADADDSCSTLQLEKVDCANLACNRSRASVCGGKLDGHTWRYRLFLNECYLKKVNCEFKFDVNSEFQSVFLIVFLLLLYPFFGSHTYVKSTPSLSVRSSSNHNKQCANFNRYLCRFMAD